MASTPHDPGRGSGKRTSERKHLNTGIVFEGVERDNAVLDSISGTGADEDSAHHLEDGTEDHGLSIGDGAGGDRGCPGVCDIVWRGVRNSHTTKEGYNLLAPLL